MSRIHAAAPCHFIGETRRAEAEKAEIGAATTFQPRTPYHLSRRHAVETIRRTLRKCVAVILFLLAHVPSAAAGSELHAAYDLIFAGVTIAKADVRVAIGETAYTVHVTYRTTGAGRLMGRAQGEALSTGALQKGRLLPIRFNLAHQGSQRTQKVDLAMAEGSVRTMTIDPPVQTGAQQGTPITREHLKNVTDPLSALFLPVAGAEVPCDRTLPVFDGIRRVDVALKMKETRTARQGPYVGSLAACDIQLTHIAGQSRDASRTRDRPLTGIEVSFGVLDAPKIYVPVSLSAKMGYLTMAARLTELSGSGSNQ
jgi:hypothetical protein